MRRSAGCSHLRRSARWLRPGRSPQRLACPSMTWSFFTIRTSSPCGCCLVTSLPASRRWLQQVVQFEIGLARRLAETESPVAALDPRAEPRAYERDGFALTLWTYYAPAAPAEVSPADYAQCARAPACRHAPARCQDAALHRSRGSSSAPGRRAAASPRSSTGADRELLSTALRSRRQAIADHGAAEQLLHGEPHPGNVLSTTSGLLFIDFETCCRGPVEFDLAHVPEDVSERYAGR